MKKLFCAALALVMALMATAAVAKGPEDPHKGDQGGEISKKIEAAILSGKDPSIYVNTELSTTPKDPVRYQTSVVYSPTYFTFSDTYTPFGVSGSVYELFRSHALKWYNYSTSLQWQFGNFSAYFAYAYNAETGNYYKYGHSAKMTLDQYLKMIITANKMPYEA